MTKSRGKRHSPEQIVKKLRDADAFLLLEPVVASSGQEQEPVAVADVLHVGEAATFAMGALPVSQVDLVLLNKFPIHGRGIFPWGIRPVTYHQ